MRFGLIRAFLLSRLAFVSRVFIFIKGNTAIIGIWSHWCLTTWSYRKSYHGHPSHHRSLQKIQESVNQFYLKSSDVHPSSSFPSLWSFYSCSYVPMKQWLIRYICMWLILTVVQFWKTFAREIFQSFTSAILVVYNLSDHITACQNSSRLTKWTRFTSQF